MFRFVALATLVGAVLAGYGVPEMHTYPVNHYEAPVTYDVPMYEAPKYEVKYEAPKYQAPKYDVPKYDVPKYEAPKYDAPAHTYAAAPAPYKSVDRHFYAPKHAHGDHHSSSSSSSSSEEHHHACHDCRNLKTSCNGIDEIPNMKCHEANIKYVFSKGCRRAVIKCGRTDFELMTKKGNDQLACGKNFQKVVSCNRRKFWSTEAVNGSDAHFKVVYCLGKE